MSKLPLNFLGVSKEIRGISYNILEVELENGIYAGIQMRLSANGLVPFYEEHDARITAGYTEKEWRALSRWERAVEVAHMRIKSAVKNHQAEAESKHMNSKMKAK